MGHASTICIIAQHIQAHPKRTIIEQKRFNYVCTLARQNGVCRKNRTSPNQYTVFSLRLRCGFTEFNGNCLQFRWELLEIKLNSGMALCDFHRTEKPPPPPEQQKRRTNLATHMAPCTHMLGVYRKTHCVQVLYHVITHITVFCW